jgi:hypothetical protein
MEAGQFDRMRVETWQQEGTLTPCGRLMADEYSSEVPNHHDYVINKEEHDTYHEYTA